MDMDGHAAIFKMDNQLSPIRDSAQRLVAPGWEGSLGRMDTCIHTCMAESLWHPPEIVTALFISFLQHKIKGLK